MADIIQNQPGELASGACEATRQPKVEPKYKMVQILIRPKCSRCRLYFDGDIKNNGKPYRTCQKCRLMRKKPKTPSNEEK